jgi:uncharacterized membrane protein
MNTDQARHPELERMLAIVLHQGTWLASGVIALGLALAVFNGRVGARPVTLVSSDHVIAAGIALLILLPVLRVTLMLVAFLREHDYRFGAIAALVLLIIFMGLVLGTRTSTPMSPAPAPPDRSVPGQ